MKHLRYISLLAVCMTLLLPSLRAQGEFSGIYEGAFTIQITGGGANELVTEEVFLTIDNHGNLRVGEDVIEGPIFGTVDAEGNLSMDASTLGWLVTEGTISDGVIEATNTVTAGPVIQNYRLDATKIGEISVDNEAPFITATNAATLNPETGLYEQEVLVYTGIDGLPYFEIQVYNLLPGVFSLVDASYVIRADPNDDESLILGYALIHAEPAPADTELTFTLEYEVVEETPGAILTPVYLLGLEPGVIPTPPIGAVTIEKISPEEARITFTVEPGNTYQLRWSRDLMNWTDEPEFVAEETSWEWITDFTEPELFFQLGAVAP